MNHNKRFLGMVVLTGGFLLGAAVPAHADLGYEWNDKLGRGVLNMVGSPVEIARTIHVQSNVKGPAYGWTMGLVEGVGRGITRFGAGALDTLTCPFDFPKGDKGPLMQPVYPWTTGTL